MAHILIVGKSFSGLKNFLSSNGHTYRVLQDKQATKFPNKKLAHRVVCSFQSRLGYLHAVDELHADKPIEAVIATYESYVVAAAIIASHLNLPGMREEAAIACTDKEVMRKKFALSDKQISPDFHTVGSREDLIKFANSHDFPLILKPANLAKSLLVTKNDSLQELLENYDKLLELADATYEKYAPNSIPKFIVEEFLEGSIHSVDAFIDATGEPHVLEEVVDYVTGYDIGYDDNFHYARLLPSKLSSVDTQAIRRTAEAGCRLLGMTSSPAHIEIILTKNGPRIVEIGARNGGYRERMHKLANGIDITANALALALDQPLSLAAKKHSHAGVFELFPKTPGYFVGINDQTGLENISSLNYLSVKAKPGQYVGKSGDGYKMCAVVILANRDSKQFTEDASVLKQNHPILAQPY